MRALRSPIGKIPRAYKDHRSLVALSYREYCLNAQAQWGPLPPIALSTLREAGRAVVELERLGLDLEVARARKQRRDATRIRKQQFMLREQLQRLERRLEELAPPRTSSAQLHAVQRAVQEANRR